MVLKIGPEAKLDLPPIPNFYPILGNFIALDWPLVPTSTDQSGLVFKTLIGPMILLSCF